MATEWENPKVLVLGPNVCETASDLFQSPVFHRVLTGFIGDLQRHLAPELEALKPFLKEGESGGWDTGSLANLLLLLTEYRPEEISRRYPEFRPVLEQKGALYDFIEKLYNHWRKFARFLIVDDGRHQAGETASDHRKFIELNERFTSLVLEVYRKIEANLMERLIRVYRQLPSGAGAGILANRIDWDIPGDGYTQLAAIPFIQLVVIKPPVVYYPRRNYRKGMFTPIDHNPLAEVRLEPREWLCYPARVGHLLTFVYFHKHYLPLGISLANLFELATPAEIEGRRPDAILVFGIPHDLLGKRQTVYYEDQEAGLILGLVGRTEEVDYFGYFKKMILTLHNLIAIERGYLPIHGAMARIVLRTGTGANIILVGDSGAGKSESLEAFRVLAADYLRRLTVIFDDMGSLRRNPEGRVVGLGTEIGAFVRLDDLSPGFPYAEIDRCIFMNPHKKNARLVIPVTTYEEITRGYPVDIFLYANNYEQVDANHPYLEFLNDVDTALEVFSEGARFSKGTTDEEGLVHTYFANPFGAPQKREKHDALARTYLEAMLEGGVRIGQLRTQLGLQGYELKGPESAARALFDFITSRQTS